MSARVILICEETLDQLFYYGKYRVVETWMDDHRHYFYASNFIYPFKRVELDEKERASLREHKALRLVPYD